jgi:hypothetical protein
MVEKEHHGGYAESSPPLEQLWFEPEHLFINTDGYGRGNEIGPDL